MKHQYRDMLVNVSPGGDLSMARDHALLSP